MGEDRKNGFRFGFGSKLAFYFFYIWHKLTVIFEVKKPGFKMWLYEFLYSVKKIFDYKSNMPFPFNNDLIVTRFGKFFIRPFTADAAIVSPAFERRDINRMLNLTDYLLNQGRKILFLDIGSDIGSYCVTMGNKFKNRNLKIIAFEPLPDSVKIIHRNIEVNNLSKIIKVYPYALSDIDNQEIIISKNDISPGSSSSVYKTYGNATDIKVTTKKLDTIIDIESEGYTTLIVKIDVEGMEKQVLEGAKKILKSVDETYLLIEDFVDFSIVEYLNQNNFEFIEKRTTYNSWWRYSGK
jgi:FkbM family methyltransferase